MFPCLERCPSRLRIVQKPARTDKEPMIANSIHLNETELARFNELMAATYKKVYNMAYRLSGSRSDAEDLTQDAYYRAYRNFHDYEGDRPFENWIFRIVTRLFLDLLRSRRRRVKTVSYDNPIGVDASQENLFVDMPDHSPNAEQNMMQGAFSEDLQAALNSLSAEQRLLINLADIENVPYKEIAEIMNKPVGTIRSRLHRTHKLLRHRLEQIRAKRLAPAMVRSKLVPQA